MVKLKIDTSEPEIIRQFNGEDLIYIDPNKAYLHKISRIKGFHLVHKLSILSCSKDYGEIAYEKLIDEIKRVPAIINVTTNANWSSLMLLCANLNTLKSENMIEVLLKLGANANTQSNKHDATALMLLFYNKKNYPIRLIDQLIEATDLDLKTTGGTKASHFMVLNFDIPESEKIKRMLGCYQ